MFQHVLIILLTSGLVTFCSCDNYTYYLINITTGWEEAQTYCRNNYVDLATIRNTEDMEQVDALAAASNDSSEIWIGLRETGNDTSWLWSTSTSQGAADYDNWAEAPAPTHHCGGMRSDGKWLSASCTAALPFVCQGGNESHKVVLQNSTWRHAQDYCRQHHLDLASAENEEQNQALRHVINQSESQSLVWMGLFRDEWRWSDQSNASFRYWNSSQPNNEGQCTLYNLHFKTWWDRQCTYAIPFLCYKITSQTQQEPTLESASHAASAEHLSSAEAAEPEPTLQRTVRTVRMKIQPHSLIDLNDPTVCEAMLTQFRSKLEGVKLHWKVQSDGKIFHKEEEDNF